MTKAELFDEHFIFRRDTSPPDSEQLVFYSYLDSSWLPPARIDSGGGEYITLFLTLRGRCRVDFGHGASVVCEPGSFTALDRPYRSASLLGGEPLARQVILLYRTALGRTLLREMFGTTEFTLPIQELVYVSRWFDRIREEMEGEQDDAVLAGLVSSLLHEVKRQGGEDARPRQLREILAYIDDHLQDVSMSRQSIARHFAISIRTLCRLFEEHMQCSPGEYVTEVRLRQVKKMLAISTLSIKGIAAQTGFASSNYLCRLFKRHVGMSPQAFRQPSSPEGTSRPPGA